MGRHLFSFIIAVAVTVAITGGAAADDSVAPKFRTVEIDTSLNIGYGLEPADVDGDGRVDIVVVDRNRVLWYRNPKWEKHVIAESLTKLDHVCVAARDIDGDGKTEIAIGAGWNPGDTETSGSVHFLIAPEDRTERWEAIPLPHEPTVHRMRWRKRVEGGFDLVVLPLHGRGSRGGGDPGVRFIAYHPPENPRDPWETVTISHGKLHKAHNFALVPNPRMRSEEILTACKEGVQRFDEALDRAWLREPLVGTDLHGGSGEVAIGRGIVTTIEPMHGHQLVVYTEPEEERRKWTRTVIDDSLIQGHGVICDDFLGRGDDQIAVGWRGTKKDDPVGVKLFQRGENGEWSGTLIDDGMACEDLEAADIDGDGKLDLIACGRRTNNLRIYFNARD